MQVLQIDLNIYPNSILELQEEWPLSFFFMQK